MQTIGFVGLGHMGGNMAARYLGAGYTVYGETRSNGGSQWLIDQVRSARAAGERRSWITGVTLGVAIVPGIRVATGSG